MFDKPFFSTKWDKPNRVECYAFAQKGKRKEIGKK
jgi:hypothetical protein